MAQHQLTTSSHGASGHQPVRTCVGCRKRGLRSELVRVVALRGRAVVDHRRRLPGRGAWLHPDQRCLTQAIRRKALPRALRVSGQLDTGELEDSFASGLVSGTQDEEGYGRPVPRRGNESRSTRHESAVKLKP
ncbi:MULTISPECIES: YlxR family protein [Thermocrispum]|uniref:YlxR family protein n=1 Tax=Thermocrispum sp. TaxID=2060768 RepID=UPI0009FDE95B|nr:MULTISPECIES: YlxR family protein [Thermocrispum]